jgi:hypothetical protein
MLAPMRLRLLVCLLGLVACGGAQRPDTLPAAAAGLFRDVPADSPYVFGLVERLPAEHLRKTRGRVPAITPSVTKVIAELVASPEPGLRFLGGLASRMDFAGLVAKGGVERLVLYGRGLYPVLRVRIDDPAEVKAIIAKSAAESKVTLVERGHGMRSVSAGTVGDIVFGVRDGERELVAGLAAPGQAGEVAEHLAGKRPPAKSYRPVFDLGGPAKHGFAAVHTARVFEATAALIPELHGCGRELAELAAVMPQLLLSVDSVTDRDFSVRLVADLDADAASRLAALRVNAPGMGLPLGDGILNFGIALDLARGVAVLADAAHAFAAKRHQCPVLRELDEAALGLARELDGGAAVLGAYREIRGLSLHVRAIDPGDPKGFLLVTASDPIQLFDMVKGLVPGLTSVQLRGDGTPVLIPAGTLYLPTDGWVAVRGQTLGVGLGAGTDKTLAAGLAASAPADRPVLVFDADEAKLQTLFKTLGALVGTELADAMEPSGYRIIRLRTTFDERGIVMTVTMEI